MEKGKVREDTRMKREKKEEGEEWKKKDTRGKELKEKRKKEEEGEGEGKGGYVCMRKIIRGGGSMEEGRYDGKKGGLREKRKKEEEVEVGR